METFVFISLVIICIAYLVYTVDIMKEYIYIFLIGEVLYIAGLFFLYAG